MDFNLTLEDDPTKWERLEKLKSEHAEKQQELWFLESRIRELDKYFSDKHWKQMFESMKKAGTP